MSLYTLARGHTTQFFPTVTPGAMYASTPMNDPSPIEIGGRSNGNRVSRMS